MLCSVVKRKPERRCLVFGEDEGTEWNKLPGDSENQEESLTQQGRSAIG